MAPLRFDGWHPMNSGAICAVHAKPALLSTCMMLSTVETRGPPPCTWDKSALTSSTTAFVYFGSADMAHTTRANSSAAQPNAACRFELRR